MTHMAPWTIANIPPQNGKFAIVTGANSGIGYDTALELARAGAEVIIASRNAARGEAAVERIKAELPRALVRFETLDLASLASVRYFAGRIKANHGKLDILVNNAGVMALPRRRLTVDGFETQLGVNFLGHFLLTALLLPLLMKAEAPRVVQVSSIAHRHGKIALDDLQAAKSYKPWRAYRQSKLAMLMFALELQRRSDAAGWGIMSLAAHPGIATTALVANGPGDRSLTGRLWPVLGRFVTHSSAAGALPTLFAATARMIAPGGYYGPAGFREFRGPPMIAKIEAQARDAAVAQALWAAAERLTGQAFTPGP
jgi:NAD(P)-dependent dehydrogenase (short-subunit alcohol dehydrogenase family)